jgi:hypothetical protein
MREIANILLLILFGIAYLTSYTKVQTAFFNRFSNRNNAYSILFIASVLSSGIVLIDISKVMTEAFLFFYDQKNLVNAFIYLLLYFTGAWFFSWLLFRSSFFLVSIISKENELEELSKNNVELSLIHSSIIILLAFVVAPSLSEMAASFIPYPKLPF